MVQVDAAVIGQIATAAAVSGSGSGDSTLRGCTLPLGTSWCFVSTVAPAMASALELDMHFWTRLIGSHHYECDDQAAVAPAGWLDVIMQEDRGQLGAARSD